MVRRSPFLIALGLSFLLSISGLGSAHPIRLSPSSITAFYSTADFDAGTKTNVETSTDTCSLRIMGEYGLRSADYHGVSSGCIAGASMSTIGLLVSYNFETLATGKIKDFSVSANDGTITGTSVTTGTYGLGRGFPGLANNKIIASVPTTPTSSFTVHFVIHPNTTATGGIFWKYGSSAYFDYSLGAAGAFSLYSQIGGSLRTTTVTATINAWHDIVVVYNNANSTWGAFVDKRWTLGEAASGSPNAWTQFLIGQNDAANYFFSGIIDEMQIWNRALTVTEVSNLQTDGRSIFLTSGSWTSALENVTTGEYVSYWSIVYSGVTAANKIASVQLLNSTGHVLYSYTTAITSGTNKNVSIALQTNLTTHWKIRLALSSDSTGTPIIANVLIGSAIIPDPGAEARSLINSATAAVAGLLVLMGVFIAFVAIYLVLAGIQEEFLGQSTHKRNKP